MSVLSVAPPPRRLYFVQAANKPEPLLFTTYSLKVDCMQIQLDKLKLHSLVMAIRLVLRHFAWEGGGGQGIEQETTMSANK